MFFLEAKGVTFGNHYYIVWVFKKGLGMQKLTFGINNCGTQRYRNQ
jgi:hypothetical protein